MEIRICRLFLRLACAVSIFAFSQGALAEDETESSDGSLDVHESSPLIEPHILRLDLDEAEIDTENHEVGIYYGQFNVEDFGTNETVAITAAYHVTEDFFVEGVYGMSDLQQPVESGFTPNPIINEDELELTYYNLSLGINIFPGEAFVWKDWAFNSQFYLIGGVGITEYVFDVKETTINAGAGYRLIVLDWLALRFDVRDHIFKRDGRISEAFGDSEEEITHNVEIRAGVSIFF